MEREPDCYFAPDSQVMHDLRNQLLSTLLCNGVTKELCPGVFMFVEHIIWSAEQWRRPERPSHVLRNALDRSTVSGVLIGEGSCKMSGLRNS
jgi:hypothetical protein